MTHPLVLLLTLPLLLLSPGWAFGDPALPQEAGAVPETITTDQWHFFLVPMGNAVRVAEYHVLSNAATQAYTGVTTASGQRTVGFRLPAGATNLQFDGPGLGERFVEEEGGFALTEPIPVGKATVTVNFSYDLAGGAGLSLTRESETAVTNVVAIISSTTLGLESPQLRLQGTMETDMGVASYYVGSALQPGETLSFTVVPAQVMPAVVPTAAPSAGAAPAGSGAGDWALAGLALAGAAVFAYSQWRPGAARPMPESVRPMVDEIATLDQAYEIGAVAAESYVDQRAALVARVRSRLERAPNR